MSSPPWEQQIPSESMTLEDFMRNQGGMEPTHSPSQAPSQPRMSSESLPPEFYMRPRARVIPTLPPWFLGFATVPPSQENQQSGGNPSMIMLVGSAEFDAMLSELSNKAGPSPASKASIEALPVVKMTEEGEECSICLTEYEVGGEAKEMPCKHRYHSDCIDKWLGLHGSCPVCRYKMPVDEESKKTSGGEIWVFVGHGGRRASDSGWVSVSDPVSESGDGSAPQDTEIDGN